MNQNRRIPGILRTGAAIAAAAGVGLLVGQVGPYRLPVWSNATAAYVYPYLGPGLQLQNNVLDTTGPAAVYFARQFAAHPSAGADGSFSFLVIATAGQAFQSADPLGFFSVYRNGLMQTALVDYQITMGRESANSATVRIVPMLTWGPGDVVRVVWVM